MDPHVRDKANTARPFVVTALPVFEELRHSEPEKALEGRKPSLLAAGSLLQLLT